MLVSDSWSGGKRMLFGTRPHIWSRSQLMLGNDSWSGGKIMLFGTRPHIWSRSPLWLPVTYQIGWCTPTCQYRGVRLANTISSQLSVSCDALTLVQERNVDNYLLVSLCRQHVLRYVGLCDTAKHTWPVWFCLSIWNVMHIMVIKQGDNLVRIEYLFGKQHTEHST